MPFIVHPHPCGTSGSSSYDIGDITTPASAPFSVSVSAFTVSTFAAYVSAATASTSIPTASASAAAAPSIATASSTSSTDQLRQHDRKERSHVPPTLDLEEDRFYQ